MMGTYPVGGLPILTEEPILKEPSLVPQHLELKSKVFEVKPKQLFWFPFVPEGSPQ